MFAYSLKTIPASQRTEILQHGMPMSVRNEYDTIGRLKKNVVIYGDEEKFYTTYEYNKTRISRQSFSNNEDNHYTYDNNGNITEKVFAGPGLWGTTNYAYDIYGRIIRETLPNDYVMEYAYDKNGNIVIKQKKIASTGNIVEQYVYDYDETIPDLLLKVRQIYPYNATYEREITYYETLYPWYITIKGTPRAMRWRGRRLIGIERTANYTYDANGIRTSKTVNGTTTTYDLEGDRVISMTKSILNSGTIHFNFIYDSKGMLIGVNENGREYFYIRDITGNILGIIDNTGNFVVSYTYDAWGNILEETVHNTAPDAQTTVVHNIATHNPFKYKGYIHDEETGFYYLKSRYYDPDIGRFISPDSINYIDPTSFEGLNLFAYCKNNPVMYADPSGHLAITSLLLSALAVALISGLANIVGQLVFEGKDFEEIDWVDAGISTVSGFAAGLIPGGKIISVIGQAVVSSLVDNGLRTVVYGNSFDLLKVGKDAVGQIALGFVSSIISSGISKVTSKIFIKAPNYSQYQNYFRKSGFNYARTQVYKKMQEHIKIKEITDSVLSYAAEFGFNLIPYLIPSEAQ